MALPLTEERYEELRKKVHEKENEAALTEGQKDDDAMRFASVEQLMEYLDKIAE